MLLYILVTVYDLNPKLESYFWERIVVNRTSTLTVSADVQHPRVDASVTQAKGLPALKGRPCPKRRRTGRRAGTSITGTMQERR